MILNKNYTNPQTPIQLISKTTKNKHKNNPKKTQKNIQ